MIISINGNQINTNDMTMVLLTPTGNNRDTRYYVQDALIVVVGTSTPASRNTGVNGVCFVAPDGTSTEVMRDTVWAIAKEFQRTGVDKEFQRTGVVSDVPHFRKGMVVNGFVRWS